MSEKPTYEELEKRVQILEQVEKHATRISKEWETTFNSTNDAIWILDENQSIQRCNKASEKIFQRSPQEMIGHFCWELVHGTDQPIPECPVQRSLKSLKRENMELQIAQKWFHVTADPIIDSNSKYIGAVHIIRDITLHKHMEKELIENEKKYRDLFENGSDLLCIHDLEGNLIETNLSYKEKYGLEDQDLKGLNLRDFMPGKYLTEFDQYLERILQNGEDDGYMRVFDKFGDMVILEYKNNLIYDAEGKPYAVRGSARDVTDRMRVEKALRLSKNEWLSTFDAISDWISLIDLEFKIIRSNRAGENFIKIPTEEMIGQTCCDLIHGVKEPIPGCPAKRMFETKQRESLDLHVDDMKRWIRIFADPVKDEHGNIKRAVHIVRDITNSKNKAEALRQSEERLSLATETANLGIWEWCLDTGEIKSSKGKFLEITGLSREEAKHFSLDLWLNKVHPDDQNKTKEKVKAFIAGDSERLENEIRIKHPKKGWVWLYGIGQVVERDKYGEPIRIIGVHRDITDRKKSENERERLIKELQKTLAEVKTLRGLIPICSKCKKIRDDKGYWNHLESYIEHHSDASFSHGMCEECSEELYGDEEWYIQMKKKKDSR